MKLRFEKRKCQKCGKEFIVGIDEHGRIHSFDPTGQYCDQCYAKKVAEEPELELISPFEEEEEDEEVWREDIL